MANLFSVNFAPGDPGGDNKQLWLYAAPTGAQGGKVTLVGAKAVNGAATGAGTSFGIALHKYSAAGTPVVNGTIAAAIGGTGTPWAANIPQVWTLDTAYTTLAEGEYLVGQYGEQTAGNPTNMTIMLTFQVGAK